MTEILSLLNKAHIDGRWVDAESGATFAVLDPAVNEIIQMVPDCGPEDMESAIEAAHRAFENWSMRAAKERAALLREIARILISRTDELALILSRENGKPLSEAAGEIRYGASYFDWFAEEAVRTYGDVIPSWSDDRRVIVTKHPVGVCALITPWNFPNAMLARKAAAALAAGCTVVAKPAEDTPLSALALAAVMKEAGLPDGVCNVVPANQAEAVGKTLTSSPIVQKVSFTGSTNVGRILYAQSAPTLKKLSLELGGNAPFIVFEDADLDAALEGLFVSKFRNAGQTCVCSNRIFVHEAVMDAFAGKIAARAAALIVGNGLEAGTEIGPLINERAMNKVQTLVDEATSHGATLMTGGQRVEQSSLFYQPTVLADVTPDMKVAREEIFGPLVPLISFKSDCDVIKMANDTEYGLAAYIYTENASRTWRISEALDFGMIGINEGAISAAEVPFGGVKQSGVGREGSKYGIDEYLDIKYRLFGGL